MDNNKNNNKKNNKSGPGFFGNPFISFIIISLILTVGLNYLLSMATKPAQKEIYYSEFMDMIERDQIDSVTITSDKISVVTKESVKAAEDLENAVTNAKSINDILGVGKSSAEYSKKDIVYYTGNVNDPELIAKLREHNVKFKKPIVESNIFIEILLTWVLPFGIMYLFLGIIMRYASKKFGGGGGFMSVGQSNAKIYLENKTGVTFADVAGQEEAKESLDEIVDFLHNPAKYTAIGAKQPKGALLVGPPGTGKTLLAKAVAGEANVPFFSLSGSDFVEMFVGVGASRVRDLFKQASAKAPCIIFIDEIDAIGKSRDNVYGGGNDEREQTLNQLLSEMDGFDSSKGVVILAATNRPEILDKALLRPGRFDRRIIVEKPDLKGREEILKVHVKNVKMSPEVDLHEIALATSGAVGADLANMVNEAALRAVRMKRNVVLQEDLMEAVEVIIAGKEKKDRILSEKEKKIVAYHEVGHALAAALQKNTDPVQKITIVPRTMGALGYTMQMPEEEKYLMSADELFEDIVTLVSGRMAEELIFNIKTTGAANDIERASKLARAMVAQYGMSDEFGMTALESTENKYLDGRNVSNCSEETKTKLDNEVVRVIKEAHEKSRKLLGDNLEALHKISDYLIEKETITGTEFMRILREVRGTEDENSENADKKAEDKADMNENSTEAADSEKASSDTAVTSSHENEPENTNNDLQNN